MGVVNIIPSICDIGIGYLNNGVGGINANNRIGFNITVIQIAVANTAVFIIKIFCVKTVWSVIKIACKFVDFIVVRIQNY
jgi:hypothetical protein